MSLGRAHGHEHALRDDPIGVTLSQELSHFPLTGSEDHEVTLSAGAG
jgi:hypothetical protein